MVTNLLSETFLIDQKESKPKLKCDNQATIAITKSDSNRRKIRHIDLRYLYIKKCITESEAEIEYVRTENNKADGLTKVVGSKVMLEVARKLNLYRKETCVNGGAINISNCGYIDM